MKLRFFNLYSVAVFFFCLIISISAKAQRDYQVRTDPSNNKRKIIDIKPAVRKLPNTISTRNVLDAAAVKRPALPFKPFEMRNPKTGKELNPNAVITIKVNDSVTRKGTVKQFYDELNEMEKALTARGRTLRVSSTFADLKPNFVSSPYAHQPKLPYGFSTTQFKTNSNPAPSYNASTGKLYDPKGYVPIKPIVGLTIVEWEPELYIAERYENHGTVEFPAEWVKSTIKSKARKIFPLVVEVPKGFDPLVKRIDWQVADKPFDNTLQDINVAGIRKTGTVSNPVFSAGVRGTDVLPKVKNSKYASLYIDLSQVEPEPVNATKVFYIRAIAYSAANEVLKISPQVIAQYGSDAKPIKVAAPEYNTVPGFNYEYPTEKSIPFGLYLRGEGFSSYKSTYYDKNDNLQVGGYRVKASARLGFRYFNFMSLISESEPLSKEFNVITANFLAAAGNTDGYKQGVKLSLNVMEGLYKPEIDFMAEMPNVTAIPLEYTIKEPIDWELINSRFFIGPVPFRVSAGIGGEAGVELSGLVNLSNYDFSGTIRPYLKTFFKASGGVDAIIAYATLNAEVNPLLEMSMPVTFSSTGKALTYNNTLAALNGRVFLAVGFFYPCPSIEKIVGWISGDEDLPLCECKWEYNIFDFKGYNTAFGYESK